MNKILLIASLAALIAISGCTSVQNGGGLSVALQADPPRVFSSGFTTLHIDLDNRQSKTISNVVVELFDTGLLQSEPCRRILPRMLPNEFQSVACTLSAPEVIESIESEINVKTTFESQLSANQVFELMDEDEHERRRATGTFAVQPDSYSYRDKNVQLQIDFSENPPLVVRPGKEYFVYLTIKNVGNGFVSSIKPGDLVISYNSLRPKALLDCPVLRQKVVLYPNGDTFPRIACNIILTGPVDSLENSDFIATLSYEYEIRNSLRISVVK